MNLSEIVAYCLMPNHYHLLIYCGLDLFSNKVIQPLMVSYTKKINMSIGRVGPLFQGPFKASLVDQNAYLLQITRYIHLNPVAAGLVSSPEEWEFSSYRDYVGLRKGTLISPEIVLNQFPSRQDYSHFVCSQIGSKDNLPEGVKLDFES